MADKVSQLWVGEWVRFLFVKRQLSKRKAYGYFMGCGTMLDKWTGFTYFAFLCANTSLNTKGAFASCLEEWLV